MSKNSPNLKSQAKAIFIGNFFATLLQFLIPAMLVRLITKEDFGVYRQFQLLAATFISLLNFGLNTSFFYFFPRLNFQGKQKLMQQTQLFFMVILLLFSFIIILWGDFIFDKLNFGDFKSMKWTLLIYIFAMILSSGMVIVITIEKRLLLNKVYPPGEKLIYFVVFALTILFIPGYMGPIISLLIFGILKLIFFYIYNYKYFKELYKPEKSLVVEQLSYSLPFGFALILGVISGNYDKFFINLYITPEEYAVYSLSFLGIPLMAQFYQSVHNVVVQEISFLLKNNNLPAATVLWQKTVEKTSSVTIPVVILFMIIATELITILYTEKYADAANYYRVFILMFLVTMFSHEIILRGINRTRVILVSNIIGAILVVLIGYFSIPSFGLNGAIFTALVGAVSPIIISLLVEKKIMGLQFSNWVNWRNIWINFVLSLIIAVPLFFLKGSIENIYLRVFCVVLIYTAWVFFFQMKYKIFIFGDKIGFLRKYKL